MNDSSNCQHNFLKKEDFISICLNCGCIMYKETLSIKPVRYLCKPDLNSLKIISNSKLEKVSRNNLYNNGYFEKRKDVIKMFHILIHKLNFKSKTFYLALSLFDKIFSENTDLTQFLLYGLACIILSAKFVENDCNIPRLNYFISTSKIDCDLDIIKKYEINSIQLLNYKLDNMTAYDYVNLLLFNGIVFENEEILLDSKVSEEDSPNVQSTLNSSYNSPLTVKILKRGYLEKLYNSVKENLISFTEDSMSIQYGELDIACSCVALARVYYRLSSWNIRFEQIYRIKFIDFIKCFEDMNKFFFGTQMKNIINLPLILNKDNLKQSNKKLKFNKSESSVVSPIKLAKFSKVVIDDVPFSLDFDINQNTIEKNIKEMPKFDQIETFILKKDDQIKQYTKSKMNLLSDNEKETKTIFDVSDKEQIDNEIIDIGTTNYANSGSKIKRSSKRLEGIAEDDLISKTKKVFLRSKNYFSKNFNKDYYIPKLSGNIEIANKDFYEINNNFPFSANNKNNFKLSNFQLITQNSEITSKNKKGLQRPQLNISKNVESIPTHFNYGQTNKLKIKQFSDLKINKNNIQNGHYPYYESYLQKQERKYISKSRVFSREKLSENLFNNELDSTKLISSMNIISSNIRNTNMNYENSKGNTIKTSSQLYKKFSD